MDAPFRQRFGDFRVSRDLGTEDDDVQLLGVQHLPVVPVFLRLARDRHGSLEICLAASLDLRQRRNIGDSVGAGHQLDLFEGDESLDEFVHVHVGEPDDPQPIGLLLFSHVHPDPPGC